jgi:hypothetical protein
LSNVTSVGSRFHLFKQIKLTDRADFTLVSHGVAALDDAFEYFPAVAVNGWAVDFFNGAGEPHDSSLLRPPGQYGQGCRFGKQEQIRLRTVRKPLDGGCVEADAVFKRRRKVARHNGYVFLNSEGVAKSKTNKLHVVFPDEIQDIFDGSGHCYPP